MTDPSGDKDRPAEPYDPPPTAEPAPYSPENYDPPAAEPDAAIADPPAPHADATAPHAEQPPASQQPGAFETPAAEPAGPGAFETPATEQPPASQLPPGAFETPAAHIPGTPYVAPGQPQAAYAYQQPYPPAYGRPYAPPAPYGVPPYGVPPQRQDNALAIGALVCSILGFCSGVTAIAGLVMGHIALSKTNRGEAGGRGLATAAVIVGYVVVALWAGFFTTLIILGVNGQLN
ncbi:DUF4190 domain-containing protein [Amycolatopsis stemonae]